MPGLVPGIHVFSEEDQDVDGRDKPGHDGDNALRLRLIRPTVLTLAAVAQNLPAAKNCCPGLTSPEIPYPAFLSRNGLFDFTN
jgi:hypothetical protein